MINFFSLEMLICSVGLWEEKEFRRYSDTGQTKRKAGESEEAFWFFKWSFSAVVVSVNIPVCNLSVRFLVQRSCGLQHCAVLISSVH